MIECGICHLVTGETQEVLALEQQIIEFLKEHSEISYVSESLWLYFAACEKIRGNVNRAGELMDKILVSLQEEEAVRKFIKHIMFLAAFLGEEQDDDRLGRLMDIVQKGVVEQYISIYLDCYPFLEAYLLRVGRITEYVQYTKKYFSLYERHVKENYKVTAMMLELRDKLESVKTQQDNIRAYNRQLESIAMHDSMTGLANRTYLNEYLAGKFERAFLQQELLGVELMDIDCFKQYNDTYGHLAGDKCIEAIADVLHSIQNEKIFCARYGGDEFVLVYSGMDLEGIRQTAKKIQERVRELVIPHIYNLCARHVTVSQGIFARIPMEENREWDFNAMADKALYEAKNVGRNCFCVRTEFE